MADSIEHTRLDRIRPAVIEAFKQKRAPEVEVFDTQPLAESPSVGMASSTLDGTSSNESRKSRLCQMSTSESLSLMKRYPLCGVALRNSLCSKCGESRRMHPSGAGQSYIWPSQTARHCALRQGLRGQINAHRLGRLQLAKSSEEPHRKFPLQEVNRGD